MELEDSLMKMIYFTKDFTDTPGGRYKRHGDYSGEQFREDILEPALKANDLRSACNPIIPIA